MRLRFEKMKRSELSSFIPGSNRLAPDRQVKNIQKAASNKGLFIAPVLHQ